MKEVQVQTVFLVQELRQKNKNKKMNPLQNKFIRISDCVAKILALT